MKQTALLIALIGGFLLGSAQILHFNTPIPSFVVNIAIKECESNHGLKAIQKHIFPQNSYTFFCRNTARFVSVSFSPLLVSIDETQKEAPETKQNKSLDSK